LSRPQKGTRTDMDLLTQEEIDQALADDLPEWEQDGTAIARELEAPTFLDGISLVQRVAEAAENMDHHPDIDIRYTTLTFTLSTHSEGGLTRNDLELAAKIDRLAADL
jgi:4a-hydroxytetrahydrobiopterin dehydratase